MVFHCKKEVFHYKKNKSFIFKDINCMRNIINTTVFTIADQTNFYRFLSEHVINIMFSPIKLLIIICLYDICDFFFFFGVALNLFEFFLSNTGFFIFFIIFLKNLNNTSDQGESLIKLSHQFKSIIFLENERLIDGLFIHLFFNGLIDDLGLVYTHTHIFFLKGVPSLHNVNRDNQSHSNMKGSTKFAIKVSLLSSP